MELTDTPMKDFPALWKVYDHIVAHPKEWDQTMWARKSPACGTSFCFAGHAVNIMRPDLKVAYSHPEDTASALVVGRDGQEYDIEMVARDCLGLNYEEASELFCAVNALSTIRDLIAGWEAEENASV